MAFSENGLLASGSQNGTIWLWNLNKKGDEGYVLEDTVEGMVPSLAFSSNGKFLLAASSDYYGTVFLWYVDTRSRVESLKLYWELYRKFGGARYPMTLRSIEFSPDGKTVALASDSVNRAFGYVFLWSLDVVVPSFRVTETLQEKLARMIRKYRIDTSGLPPIIQEQVKDNQ